MRAFSTASRSIFGWVSAAVAVAVIAISASVLAVPGKAYADTASHIEATGEIHVLVDGAGNASIPSVTFKNTGSVAAYITGCTAPDELSGWTCDAVGKRIEPGQSVQASWSGQVSAETAAKLGSEAYFAGTLTYSYDDAVLKGTVAIDNLDPCVGDTVTASASGLNVSDDQVTYQWYRVKDGVETAIDDAVQPAYTVVDADAGCTLLCKLFSSDSICIGSISSDATHEVKRLEAFAVYSADDQSLSFYKRAEVPMQGTMYLGKRATAVYTGLESMTSAPGWMLNYSKDIKTATVYDEGISPTDTGFWFAELRNMKTVDVSKLDMSKCKSIGCMFTNCTSLEALDLSAWDTRSLTDMGQAFQNCTSLTKLNVSGWDVSKVTNMNLAFAEDRALSSLDLSTWDNSAATSMKDAFSMMNSLSKVSLGSKFKFVGTNPFLPEQTGHVTGADGKWYDADGNGYAPADVPSNKAMTYYASKDLLPKAFAVYSDDDQSLNFYKRSGVPAVGGTFEGKKVTAVYTGIEEKPTTQYPQWKDKASKIKTAVVVDNGIKPVSTAHWFDAGYRNLATVAIAKLDTSSVTDMNSMFGGCPRLTSVDGLSSWDTSNVTNMNSMFDGCNQLTFAADLSSWNTSSVTNMNNMFNSCYKLTSVDGLSNWDTSNVTDMAWMFGNSYLTSVDGLSNWDTSNVTNMNNMFNSCYKLTSVDGLSNWDTSNVTDMNSMFEGCSRLTSVDGLSSWDTSNVTDMGWMFRNCSYLTSAADLSSWNTSSVTNMNSMFDSCSRLTSAADLSSWNTSNITNMGWMFNGCSRLTSVDGLSNWDTSSVTDMACMFHSCFWLTSVGDLSNWDTSNVTRMDGMFGYCSYLTSVDGLSNWDTSSVTDMNYMFYGCKQLNSVGDLSNWDTSKVTNMNSMFYYCSKLTSLGDLSNWDTSNVTKMSNMFAECSKLSADCSNWDVSKVTDHSNFNKNATGVIIPLAWRASSDEGVEDSAIAPLCDDQGNGDMLSVPSENNNSEPGSKTDGEASADSDTVGSATTSADDVGAKEEEVSDDIVQEEPIAA